MGIHDKRKCVFISRDTLLQIIYIRYVYLRRFELIFKFLVFWSTSSSARAYAIGVCVKEL